MNLDLFRSTQNQLEMLRTAWERTPQSKGGVVNLRGFHYQLATTLVQLVRNWSGKSEVERSRPWTGLVVEGLSDWTAEGGDGIVVCQVKLTQDSGAVLRALEEFWLIDQIASTTVPQLHTRLKFLILSRQVVRSKSGTLYDASRTIERWNPAGETDEEKLKSFRRKVSATVAPDPEIELLAILANRFHATDPLERFTTWVGRLVRGSTSQGGFDEALLTIWNDLQALHSQDWLRRPPGYLWMDQDRPPELVTTGPVLVGQRPTIEHLRDGYFVDRAQIYDGLVAEVEAWLRSPAERSIPKVRMFWIGGRSGSGKTIALLHVLARLHERGAGIVIWLEDKLRLLPEAVRWSRPLLREGRTVIIGIDDPYNPLNQGDTRSALTDLDSELMSLRQQMGQASMPYILCSGPSEQRARLKKDYPSVVEIASADLPIETAQELEGIWVWFCNRTGNIAPLPYHSNSDVLLVQLFFEWRTGEPIVEFAARFRQRIRGMDHMSPQLLEDLLSRMLALNRLYAGYPAGALNELRQQPALDAAFRRLLNEEHHLAIEEYGLSSGLRLTHPHLANALYNAWYDPAEDEAYRRAHLRAGIVDAIEYGTEPRDRVAPLWAIARSNPRARGGEWSQRLSVELLQLLLPDAYVELQNRFNSNLPAWLIPVWIEIQAQFPDLLLRPSPIDLAVQMIDGKHIHETGIRLACHKLLQNLHALTPAHQAKITESIRNLLLESLSWREWAAVATDYLTKTRKGDLGAAIYSWILAHSTHSDTPNLLQAALHFSANQEVFDAACWWLDSAAVDHPSWSFLWQDLLQAFPEQLSVLTKGRAWLDRVNPSNPSWGFVWRDLRRALSHSQELVEVAFTWLDSTDVNNRSWTFVWEGLWSTMPNDTRLIERGRKWLEESDINQPSWTFMWQHLWSEQPGEGYLVELGMHWLDQAELDDATWYFVWNDLSDFLPEGLIDQACVRLDQIDPKSIDWTRLWLKVYRLKLSSEQIKKLGKKWLLQSPQEMTDWAKIWYAMHKLEPDDNELLRLGRIWLDSAKLNIPGWGKIWTVLWQTSQNRDYQLERAVQWLEAEYPNGETWGLVWRAIVNAMPGRTDILTLGQRWLSETDQNNNYWGLVWASLFRTVANTHDLLERGLEWLNEAAFSNPNWGLVWLMLIRVRPDDPDLLDLARSWLLDRTARSIWFGFIWGAVIESNPQDPHTIAIGRQWLDGADPGKGYWGTNWDRLQREHSDDNNLRDRGLRWIQGADPSARFWGAAWCALHGTWSRSSEFLGVGFDWIAHAEVSNPTWSRVWLALNSAYPSDPRLQDAARRFLTTATAKNPNWWAMFVPIWEMLPKKETYKSADYLLRANVHNRLWPSIWLEMHQSGFVTKELLELARTWIIHTPFNGNQWRYVWEVVYQKYGNDEELFEVGRASLVAPYIKKNETWRKLWGTLFKARPDDENLFRIGVDWLEESDRTTNQWRETLHVLIRWRSQDEKLFALGLRCLSSPSLSLAQWNQLWQVMLKVRPTDSQLLALGLERLEKSHYSESDWEHLWQSVFKVDGSNRDLFHMGEVYVHKQNGSFSKVSLILAALCTADPQNEELREHALRLLSENTDARNWYRLWSSLFEIRPADPMLLLFALPHLRAVPKSEHWHRLWERLYQQYPHLEELLSVAQQWLEEQFEAKSWGRVWHALYTSSNNKVPLIQLGKRWLKESPGGMSGWPTVWETLYRQHSPDSELSQLGKEWIDRADLSSVGWATVWIALFEAEPNDALWHEGIHWLDVSRRHKQWANVWKVCWAAHLGDDHLFNLGIGFLDDSSSIEWANMWLALMSGAVEREDLIEKAIHWLHSELATNNSSWIQVWLQAYRFRPDDRSLLSCAQRKLELIREADLLQLPLLEALTSVLSNLGGGINDRSNTHGADRFLGTF